MSDQQRINDYANKSETDKKQCRTYELYQKKDASGGFAGFVQHLSLCIFGFIICMFLFSFLRRRIWDYGVLAVIKRHTKEEDLIDSKQFFEPGGHKVRRPGDKVDNSAYERPKDFRKPETWDRFRLRWWIRQREIDQNILDDSTCFGWVKVLISLQMEDFLHTAGPDCVKYLILQKHLIFLAFIWTLVSCGVILPVNYIGTNITKSEELVTRSEKFLHFTLSNLAFDPQYLFVHLTLAMIFVPLTSVVLRHFSQYLVEYDDYESDSFRSVFIQGITTAHNARISEKTLRDHFEEVYPGVEIREILLVYNFSQLFYYYKYLRTIQQALLHYEAFGQLYGRTPKIVGCCCGICCYYKCSPCRPCCGTVNALDFYEAEEKTYRKLIYFEAGSRIKSRSLGMAIVTFENVEMAYKCINEYNWSTRFFEASPKSQFSRRLNSENWRVTLAPNAKDLQWNNITSGGGAWYIRFCFLNLLLLAIVIVYSTPVYFVQGFTTVVKVPRTDKERQESLKTVEGSTELEKDLLNRYIDRFIYDTLPVLLLLSAAVTLPSIVSVSDMLTGFWTRSNENRSRLIKTFTFLVFMVIIMPSIGLATLTRFFGDRFQIYDFVNFVLTTVLNWDCILAPQNGELFLNYITSATFVGTLSELLRVGELVIFSIFACCLQSPGELRPLKLEMLYEFPLGSQYAYVLLYFAMFAIFSFIFPVMTPLGLLYLVVKHYVDRYNMYFAYGPSTCTKELHATASTLVMVSSHLAQLIVAGYCITQAYFHRLKPHGTVEEQMILKESLVFFGYFSLAATMCYTFFDFLCVCPNLLPTFFRRVTQPDVFCGECTVNDRKLYFPNRLEVLADEELKGLYNKTATNRRFLPEVFEELRFLTSFTGMLHKKCVPCPDSSADEDEDEFKKMDDRPYPRPLPKLLPVKNKGKKAKKASKTKNSKV